MGMSGGTMGSAIVSAIEALNPNWSKMSPAEQAQILAYWQAIAGAIVGHIQTNADVLPAGHTGPGLQNPAGQVGVVTGGIAGGDPTETTVPISITGLGAIQ